MTIAITGAAGTLGRQVRHQLEATGADVRVIARADSVPVGPFERVVVPGGYDDPVGLAEAMRGADRVFLMSVSDLPEQRIVRHRNAIDAATRAGVDHVVLLSIRDAVIDSPFPFAAANADAESYLQAAGPTWTILHPNLYAEAIAAQAGRTVATTRVLDLPFGQGSAGYVTRADIAAVVAAVMTTSGHSGRTYDITGPTSHSAPEIAQMLTRLLDTDVSYEPQTEEQYVEGLARMGVPEVTARAFYGLSRSIAAGRFDVVASTVPDLTGREATALETHLATTVGQFQAE